MVVRDNEWREKFRNIRPKNVDRAPEWSQMKFQDGPPNREGDQIMWGKRVALNYDKSEGTPL
jgi:hypothetical protein